MAGRGGQAVCQCQSVHHGQGARQRDPKAAGQSGNPGRSVDAVMDPEEDLEKDLEKDPDKDPEKDPALYVKLVRRHIYFAVNHPSPSERPFNIHRISLVQQRPPNADEKHILNVLNTAFTRKIIWL